MREIERAREPLEILQGGEEEAKELCRGCGLKKKPVDYDDID